MSILKIHEDVILEVGGARSRIFTLFGVLNLTNSDLLRMARQAIVAVQDADGQQIDAEFADGLIEHGAVQTVEAVVPEQTTVVEPAKRKPGRPRKVSLPETVGETVAQVLEEGASRQAEPDVIVEWQGGAVAGEAVAADDGQVAVAYSLDEKRGGVTIVADEKVHELGVYDAQLDEVLRQRFPLGHRVILVDGEIGVLVKHFDDSHKVQVDLRAGVRVVDVREVGDAPPHTPDPNILERVKRGTYGADFGFDLCGAPMLLAEAAQVFVEGLGIPAGKAKEMCFTLVNGSGFINTQALAVSLALYYGEFSKPVVEVEAVPVVTDPPLTPEEVAQVRQEVKDAGVTPVQAKHLCQKHFNKESAALLTRSEMQKFLGEVLPTWVEMQGAEDF